ncbi:tetratricopeptide repeat protein [Psychrobacter frigidicola]|uniref:Tetratricopeptide repeat protein n=1 Tax=Psychrobacter frigidicola TaxID=45611 RepID=A0A5C7A224_9GAMM|nr:tetratricopeptide repeat protein [Psychrobacter frigidicola]TXD96945.1 tetratricopeptide repeat protein [Psychrobacter frigidicola]
MALFGFQCRLIRVPNCQSCIQVSLLNPINRLRQRPKLILLLAASLCVATPAHAHFFSPLLEALLPSSLYNSVTIRSKSQTTNAQKNSGNETSDNHILYPNNNRIKITKTKTTPQVTNEPNLYALLDAEFAAARGDTRRALTIYKQQSFKEEATVVFERALGLSLRDEDVDSSLQFAKTWLDQNPDHVPAWFYVAHLALKAHDYTLAGEMLSRILSYDPRADLSEILIGIYPNTESDQRELLAALQPIASQQNASLSVLKAGLLYQFNEPEIALIHIQRALMSEPDYVPFITLKADILRKIEPAATVITYISQARFRNPGSKSLYLYEIRYLLDLEQSEEAWKLLLEAHSRFDDDAEITLLAALVSLDIEEYRSADQLLNMLAKNPNYLDQAYYYLGISAERQQRFEQAKYYLNGVMQEDLVLAARKKVVAFELLNNNVDAALATLEILRQQFEVFAPESYVLQADVLWQQGEADEALRLLTRASRKYPNSELILFARTQLLDDVKDYVVKRALLNHLQALNPTNLSYQLSYAQLLLSNDRSSKQGLDLATTIIQVRYDDPRYDNELHLQALNVLASSALANDDYTQVIEYLQTPYDVLPTLRSGVLLLRAYQGLGDSDNVKTLLADLQQRFSFGQDNVNDRVQLY